MTEQNQQDASQQKPHAIPLPGRTRKDCSECGQTFRGHDHEELCLECSYKRDHPEARDGYWSWSRSRGPEGGWDIVAYWPDREPLPEPGAVVTVHRKDGTQSQATVQACHGLTWEPTGRGRIRCSIVRDEEGREDA